MWKFLSSRNTQEAPPKIASDLIVPVYQLDDTKVLRSMVVRTMFRFDHVLDPEKLRSSLERLLDREGWRKLGARLRLNDQSKLEYHVPKSYDREQRPSILYSAIHHDMPIADHKVASRLPKKSDNLAMFDEVQDLNTLMCSTNAPKTLNDFLYKDIPQLGLHVVSFRDATLVSISASHILYDAMGLKGLLVAWSIMLEGRDHEVPDLIGFDTDPLVDFGRHPKEEYKLAHKQLSIWQMLCFIFWYALEQFWWPEESNRTIFVPASFVTKLRKNARQELVKLDSAMRTYEKEVPFLSEGDVLFAWLSKIATAQMPRDSEQTVLLINILDMRRVLSKDMLPAPGVYVGNAAAHIDTFVSLRDLISQPISATAAKIRSSIVEQGTRDQLESQTAIARAAIDKGGFPILFGDANMHMVVCTNWTRARMYEVDFSAAIVQGTLEVDSKRTASSTAKPSFLAVTSVVEGFTKRNTFAVLGKDNDGNFWVAGTLRKSAWLETEQLIALAST